MNDDYETVVSWIAERAPTEVYAALVRLRLNDNTSEAQKRMGEVIREDSKLIAELRAEVERLRAELKEGSGHTLTRLRSEVERLREALKEIADAPQYDSDAGNMVFDCDSVDIARKALAEEKE
jgi:DNA repair exonuclease SbcCD ATPase subunit